MLDDTGKILNVKSSALKAAKFKLKRYFCTRLLYNSSLIITQKQKKITDCKTAKKIHKKIFGDPFYYYYYFKYLKLTPLLPSL